MILVIQMHRYSRPNLQNKESFDWMMDLTLCKDESNIITMEVGGRSVMTTGTTMTQKWPVVSLGSGLLLLQLKAPQWLEFMAMTSPPRTGWTTSTAMETRTL